MASLNTAALKRTLLSATGNRTQFICNSCRSRFLSKQTRQLHASRTAQAERQPQDTQSTQSTASRNVSSPGLESKEDKAVRIEESGNGTDVAGARDPGHVPAKTAKGLEWIGSKKWLERQSDPNDRFEGWSPKPAAINAKNVDAFLEQIKADAFGQSTPKFDVQSKAQIHASVVKITGIRLSDIQLQAIKNMPSLRTALLRKRNERKFSEVFGKGRAAVLQSLPNVSISGRRVTMYDKENERGRWKLIEKALRDRGLPVLMGDATKRRQLL